MIDSAGERESRSFSVRAYTATELIAMLARAGLARTKCYGALEAAPLSGETRLMISAER